MKFHPAFGLGAAMIGLFCNGVAEAQTSAIRGVVRPFGEATLASELSARIDQISVRPGEVFRQGERLVSFDCTRYRAEAEAARAAHKVLRLDYQSNRDLAVYDAVGSNEVALARARMEEADARARAVEAKAGECVIQAPFSGRVVEVMANVHEINEPGKPLLHIIDDKDIEIELIVPSQWLTWLKTGTRFDFQVDETGSRIVAELARFGGAVDPVSQTVKLYARIRDGGTGVLPGMSGSARFADRGAE